MPNENHARAGEEPSRLHARQGISQERGPARGPRSTGSRPLDTSPACPGWWPLVTRGRLATATGPVGIAMCCNATIKCTRDFEDLMQHFFKKCKISHSC